MPFFEGLLFLAEEEALIWFLVGFFVGTVAALGTVVSGKTMVLFWMRHLLKIDSKKKRNKMPKTKMKSSNKDVDNV